MTGLYCPVCGQRRTRRITFGRIFEKGAEQILSLDSAFLRTVFSLATRPGSTCRQYLDGRRKPFMNPVKYVFVLATLFAVVNNVLDILPASLPDNPQAVRLYKFIVSALSYLAYLYLLPVALVQSWLFRRPRTGVAESYVIMLFFYGQFLVIGILLSVTGVYPTTYGLLIVRTCGFLYLLWLLAGLYRDTFLWTLVKGLLLYLIFNIFNMGSALLLGMAMGVRPPS
ncbi:MAG: DUF3667 domain-containing protein [Acidobacteriota bacterium]